MSEITIDAIRDVVREELAKPVSPWLDGEGAAAYLGTTAATLKTWRSQGKGPRFHRVGGGALIRYHRDDLDSFVTS